MQCPACSHEAPQAEFGEELKCPSCGAFYAKALAAKQRQVASAVPAVEVVQQARAVNEAKKRPANALDAQPVVVVDIQMKFLSMVVFMVKWTLAAIPALLILIAIGAAASGLVIGWVGSTTPSPFSSSGAGSFDGAVSRLDSSAPASGAAVPPVTLAPIVATWSDKSFFAAADGHSQDELGFSLYFKNNTGRTITDFDGTVFFRDALGNEVLSAKVVSDAYFPPGETIRRGYSVRFNRFKNDHVEFRDREQSKLIVDFKPRRAAYADGEVQDF